MRLEQLEGVLGGERGGEIAHEEERVLVAIGGSQFAGIVERRRDMGREHELETHTNTHSCDNSSYQIVR